jgi:mutator protein MutT
MENSNLHVVCAVITQGEKILITRRRPGVHLEGYWEFPGGKVEDGESFEEALGREVSEELGIAIRIHQKIEVIEHQYAEASEQTFILHFFLCTIREGIPRAHHAAEMAWVKRRDLQHYTFPPADDAILAKIQELPFCT